MNGRLAMTLDTQEREFAALWDQFGGNPAQGRILALLYVSERAELTVTDIVKALGYDVFLMPDHFGVQFAIGPALAMVAEATSTIRIGTLVWQNDLRHPALLAKEAYTLGVLSDGRFEVGIGAGGVVPS